MTSLAAWCVSWFLAIGPNHYYLNQAVASTDIVEIRIMPWSRMIDGAGPLWLAFHDQREPLAIFLPSSAVDLGHAGGATHRPAAGLLAMSFLGAPPERFLPGLDVPRLVLSRAAFSRRLGDVPSFARLERLPVDAAESLSRSLGEAWLRRLSTTDSEAAAWIDRRAHELMAEVPSQHRTEVFASALVDFHAHILSIAHEIGRQYRRQPSDESSRERGFCAQLEAERGLFGLWRKAHGDGGYFGYKSADSETPGAIAGRTRAVLAPSDKRWWAEFLGQSWTGDPVHDFGFLCH